VASARSSLHETWITKNNETEYLSNFKVERYENITGTTESMEKVIVKKKNKKTEFVSSHLKQKWWTFDEMCLLFEISGLKPIEFYADHKKYEPKTKNADEMLFVVKKK